MKLFLITHKSIPSHYNTHKSCMCVCVYSIITRNIKFITWYDNEIMFPRYSCGILYTPPLDRKSNHNININMKTIHLHARSCGNSGDAIWLWILSRRVYPFFHPSVWILAGFFFHPFLFFRLIFHFNITFIVFLNIWTEGTPSGGLYIVIVQNWLFILMFFVAKKIFGWGSVNLTKNCILGEYTVFLILNH